MRPPGATSAHRLQPLRPFLALSLVAVMAGCAGPSGPTVAPTLRLESGLVPPAATSGVSTDPVATAGGSDTPAPHGVSPRPSASAAASSDPGASQGAGPTDSQPPFPNPNEQALLDHVNAALGPSCQRSDQFYADEIDSISCGGDSVPFVDYTLFASIDEMRAAYNDDVQQSESQPTATGTCAAATYETTYTIGGAIAGRIQCTTRTSSSGQRYKVIEWTRESLRILAYLSSATATWAEMIDFWKVQGGPIDGVTP